MEIYGKLSNCGNLWKKSKWWIFIDNNGILCTVWKFKEIDGSWKFMEHFGSYRL
jgi:hypothetical protein